LRIHNFLLKFIFSVITSIFIFACSDNKPDADVKVVNQDFWVGDTSSNIHGIDVSHFQQEIDWIKVKESGVTFVYVKATGGIDYLDSMFAYNWQNLEKEKMIRGAYHVYNSDDDPVEQADWFVKNVGSFKNVLPPVIDAEREGHEHVTPEAYSANLLKCLEHLEKLTGRIPIIYSGSNFAKKYLSHEDFGKYKLWIAEYEVEEPVIPNPWKVKGWQFWQNTSQDSVPGVPKEVDRNLYSERYYKLLELVK